MSVLISGRPLQERFEEFICGYEGFEHIDQLPGANVAPGKRRADYLLSNRKIIVEQKVWSDDPDYKPEKFIKKLMQERGIFAYGQHSTELILARLPDGKEQRLKMFDYIAKGVERSVANADRQIRDTRAIFEIPEALGVLIILNEDAKTLVPELVTYGLERVMQKRVADGSLRYRDLTGIVVLSDLHAVPSQTGATLRPLLSYRAPECSRAIELEAFTNTLFERWSAFNNVPLRWSTHSELHTAR